MLFGLAFAEASFFPIPPDVLLIPLCLGDRRRSLQTAFICLIGSLLGGILGYFIGYAFFETWGQRLVELYHGEHLMETIKQWAGTYGFWGVFAAALTPIPYKIFTITAGLIKFSMPAFLLASVLGRGLRFFLLAGLVYIWGEAITGFIDRWFNWLVIAFTLLLVGGFVLLGLGG